MSYLIEEVNKQLSDAIKKAIKTAMNDGVLIEAEIPNFSIEIPADRKHGDRATNVALMGAKAFRTAPTKIADAIIEKIDLSATYFNKAEKAGPGFINFFLNDYLNADIILDVIAKGKDYGKSDYGNGKKVLVEFVSANPTGPMHIGNARGGAIGDCLASVLETAGFETAREFYVNDAGNQIEKFATSLETRYLQIFDETVQMPEDAYHGEDIINHSKNFADINGDKFVGCDSQTRRDALVDYALPLNIEGLRRDLLSYRIEYDRWFKESTLHNDGSVTKIIELMKETGLTFENEGALWFKATEFGLDKDIVLVRANQIPTYIVPDIAYHYDKLVTRGYDKAVNVLGADHHGYVARMKACLKALGIDDNKLDAVIMQMVRLVREGETIKLSKRSGKAITLSTLLEEVPIDSARFFFNLREPNTHCDFDLGLAISEDSQNPVYYVQYAHARICSIFKSLKTQGITQREVTREELTLLVEQEEKALVQHISIYTDEIVSAAKAYDPSSITKYVHQLATLFHKFYNACRVAGEEEKLMQARISLCVATATVIKNVLDMLKISAPESM